VAGIATGATNLEAVVLDMIFRDGKAQIQRALVESGASRVQIEGTALLPQSVNDFPSTDLESRITLEAPNLAQLTAMLPEPIQGSVFGSGPVRIKGRQLSTDLKLDAKEVRGAKFSVGSGGIALTARKDLDALFPRRRRQTPRKSADPKQRSVETKTADKGVEPSAAPMAAALEQKDETKKASEPFWKGLDVHVRGEVKDFSSVAFAADAAAFDVTTQNDLVTLREVSVERSGNRISAAGTYRLPRETADLDAGAGDLKVKIDAPRLGDFRIQVAGAILSGHLSADADVKRASGAMNGNIVIDGKDFALGEFRAESLQGRVQVANDRADIQQLMLRINEQNVITVSGEGRVKKPLAYDAALQVRLNELAAFEPLFALFGSPEKLGGAFHADWSGKGDVTAEAHGGKLQSDARQVVYGAHQLVEAQLGGTYEMTAQQLAADAALSAKQVSGDIGADSAEVKLTATKKLEPEGGNFFDGLQSKVTAAIDNGRFQKVSVDEVRLDADTGDRLITIRELRVIRADNRITAQGTYRIPVEIENAAAAPIDAQFDVSVPKLSDFGVEVGKQILSGRLAAKGNVQVVNNAYTGSIEIDGGDFKIGGFTVKRLAGRIMVADNIADVQQLALQINGTDQIAAVGQFGLVKPHAYEAALLVEIKNLSALQPLLAVFDVKEPIRGGLKIDWSGKGEVATVTHSGNVNLALRKGAYGAVDLSEVTLAGMYGPGFAESTALRLVSGPTSFEAGLSFAERKLRIKDINLQQARMPVLTGFIFIPLNPNTPEELLPLDQRIAANINFNKLDIEKLLQSLGKPSPVTGTFTANLLAGGTFLRPTAHLKVAGRALKSKAAAKLAAAELDLTMHYGNKELTLDAGVRQAQIQPLVIKGSAPLDLEALVRDKKLDPQMPISATVTLPPSSLAFVPNLAPAVRRIEGVAGIDVRVAGTVAKPDLTGAAEVNIRAARLTNDNVPVIGGFQARLAFAEDTLRFNTFQGEIGGGTFKLGGSVKLEKLTEPVFDLRVESDEILVKRDDTVTVRVDTDVRLTGPLNAATLAGNLFVVHSRFFKEIDILPIALPGRPKPVPREVQKETNVSFPEPPLRDMKFDVAIKTRADDPFLVRGNLANGGATIDLRLGGTGLEPTLEGAINIREFTATLPFSKLTITRGLVYFSKDAPFEPKLDLQADSTLRDYLIHAYIFGSGNDPQVQLSSEPPLPHADIVALLATGITTNELAGIQMRSRAARLCSRCKSSTARLSRKAPRRKSRMMLRCSTASSSMRAAPTTAPASRNSAAVSRSATRFTSSAMSMLVEDSPAVCDT
jgi:hypothetical protein